MTHVYTHTCSRCSAEFNMPTAATPRDWALYPDRILCADCDPQADLPRSAVNIETRAIRPDVTVTFMPNRNTIVATNVASGEQVDLSIEAARTMQRQAYSLFQQTSAAIAIANGVHAVMKPSTYGGRRQGKTSAPRDGNWQLGDAA